MARLIDSGSTPPPPPAPKGTDRIRFTFMVEGKKKCVDMIAAAHVDCGRHSSKQLCLRLEPFDSDPENYEKSKAISSSHFGLRYLGNSISVTDLGSTNGTFIARTALSKSQLVPIAAETILKVADVLELNMTPVGRYPLVGDGNGVIGQAASHIDNPDWLNSNLIGEDKPGNWSYLRVTRLNNKPDHEYVILFHSAVISGRPDSPLKIEVPDVAQRGRRIDSGEAQVSPGARIFVRNGSILIEKQGSITVLLNGVELESGEQLSLETSGSLQIGETTIVLEKIEN